MIINALEYLEAAAARFPEKPAFVDERGCLSYNDCLSAARKLALHLAAALNGARNKPVAVFAGRDTAVITAFMAVLYSGNFYVPIDPETPAVRLNAMLGDLRPAAILITNTKPASLDSLSLPCPLLDTAACSGGYTDTGVLESIRALAIDTDPAYAIFTSGSTGSPKAALISHRGLIDLAEWLTAEFAFSENDRLGGQTPFFFDASVKDIYVTLKNAGTLYIMPKRLFATPVAVVDYLEDNGINRLLWAASAVKMLANSGVFGIKKPGRLDKVFFAGETMPAKQLNIWKNALPETEFINLYGPTEVTVDCCYYIVRRALSDAESVPIGHSCANKDTFLVGADGTIIEGNGEGEIYVRGTGLSLGYYRRPDMTAAAFVQNPQHSDYPETVYKTGDIARRNSSGELVFLSRLDDQIKRQGYRIELGEIEIFAVAQSGVSQAACIYDAASDNLCMFYEGSASAAEIAAALRRGLPKYMWPNSFTRMDCLPLNANGKIDKIKLKGG